MTDWVTVTKKAHDNTPEPIKKSKTGGEIKYTGAIDAPISKMKNDEINDIFEDINGEYIEESIIEIFKHEKKYNLLINDIIPADMEHFFYQFINKESSIPEKYKPQKNNIENDHYSDEEY